MAGGIVAAALVVAALPFLIQDHPEVAGDGLRSSGSVAEPEGAVAARGDSPSPETARLEAFQAPEESVVAAEFDRCFAALKALGVPTGSRELSVEEERYVMSQAQLNVDAVESRRTAIKGIQGEQRALSEALILEIETQTFGQFEAIAARRFIRGRDAFHLLHSRAYKEIHGKWQAIGCNLKNGDDIVIFVPFWSGTRLRLARSEADAIRAKYK